MNEKHLVNKKHLVSSRASMQDTQSFLQTRDFKSISIILISLKFTPLLMLFFFEKLNFKWKSQNLKRKKKTWRYGTRLSFHTWKPEAEGSKVKGHLKLVLKPSSLTT